MTDVSRRYDDFVAVNKVSFSISRGEIVGLLGHNGAGKTTIMKMLTGFLEPSSGQISISDYDISEQARQAQALIGYLPENLPVYPEMTIVDYLDYCAKLRGISKNHSGMAIRDVISKTGLADKALQPIATLSRGYKQRVGVAQALLHKPTLLILDEPTNGLDPQQTQQMRTLIRSLAGEATVILSTHIMQEVDALCDRALILDNGLLAVDSSLAELRQSNVLQIDTDASSSLLTTAMNKAGIAINYKVIEHAADYYRYHLTLDKDADHQTVCAAVATQLIKHDAKLFALSPVQYDLETVFRDIHLQREVRHAA